MRPETYTQAYQAGVLLAMVHNTFGNEELPSFIEGAVRYYALRELLGERIWQQMCARVPFRKKIQLYLSYTYQPGMPKTLMGDGVDFALGYIQSYKGSKLKRLKDRQRLKDLE